VANNGSNTVSVITTATNAVAATVTVGSLPFAVAITPNGQYAYVTNEGSHDISVIDTATNTPLTGPGYPITVGTPPLGIAITPNGQYAYVANGSSNTVSVIDTTTNPPNVMATVTVGNSPADAGIVSGLVAVTNVTPRSGPNQGGTVVTVQGFNFSRGGTGITFGGTLATVINCTSTTQCTATSPVDGSAATAHTVDVQATVNGLTSATSPEDQFTYLAGPQCNSRLSCEVSTARISVGCLSAVIFKNTVLCTPPGSDGSIGCNLSRLPPPDVSPLLACDPTTNSCTRFSLSLSQWPDPCTPLPIQNCAQCESFNGTCETVNGKFMCLHPFHPRGSSR